MKKLKENEIEKLEKEGVLYLVMRLNTHVSITNPITGKDESIEIKGGEGYIPVFNTREEASEHSDGGKYQILAIQAS